MSEKKVNPEELQDTETRILEAAKKVFLRKGKAGTNMQDIALEAGITRTLLHYYFRSKDKLFEEVFRATMVKFIPDIEEFMRPEVSLFEKIGIFTERYIQLMIDNPFVPLFMLQEIHNKPERIYQIITGSGVNPMVFAMQVMEEAGKGNIKPVDPRQLVVNMVAMCVFPVAARPLLQELLFMGDKEAYDEFLQSRRTEVSEFIINAIKVK